MSGGALLLRIVAIVFPVFALIGVGWLYGRFRKPDMAVANQLNMDLFVPALVFSALAAKSFAIAAWIACKSELSSDVLLLNTLLGVVKSSAISVPELIAAAAIPSFPSKFFLRMAFHTSRIA